MRKHAALLLVFTTILISCATLFGDKDRTVRIESNPSGAMVLFNGMPYGRTPTVVNVQNMLSNNSVMLKLEGYDEITRPIQTSLQPVAILNLFNLLCWGIDFLTGNVMRLETKIISVDLAKRVATFTGSTGRTITLSLDKLNHCPQS